MAMELGENETSNIGVTKAGTKKQLSAKQDMREVIQNGDESDAAVGRPNDSVRNTLFSKGFVTVAAVPKSPKAPSTAASIAAEC